MAKSVLEIILQMVRKGGNADKDTVRALTDVKSALMGAAKVAGVFAAAYYAVDKALDATVGKFAAYAGTIRQNSAALSLSAEDTSHLTQVLDDFGIEIDTVQKALFNARRNGIDITVEGLANMADEYNALADPQAKANYLQENFAKGGVVLAEVLKAGRAAILERNAGIQDSLILDQAAIDKAFEYELAVDEVNDSILALKVAIGQKALPLVIDIIAQLTTAFGTADQAGQLPKMLEQLHMEAAQGSDNFAEYQQTMDDFYAGMTVGEQAIMVRFGHTRGLTEAEWELAKANEGVTEAQIAMAKAGGVAAAVMGEMDIELTDLSDQFAIYSKLASDYADNAPDIAEAEAAIAKARSQGYSETGRHMTELKGTLEELQAAQELQTQQWIYNQLLQEISVDGLSEAEKTFLLEYQVSTGLLTQEAADRAAAVEAEAARMIAAIESIPDSKTINLNMVLHGSQYLSMLQGGGQAGLGNVGEYATGGNLGDVSVVGERGFEAIVRTRDGRYLVIPHEASVWMQAAGMLGGAPGYAIGNLPMEDQVIGGGSGGVSQSVPPQRNPGGASHIAPAPQRNLNNYSPTGPAPQTQAAAQQAAAQAAASAVESVAPVVTGAVQMFQSASQRNTSEVSRQTGIVERSSEEQTAEIRRMRRSIDRLPEKLAAEIQKGKR